MRRKPKPAVVPMRPVPEAFATQRARCPGCGDDGAAVVGVIALRLVHRCACCGIRFYPTTLALADAVRR
jgi:hypothetical protein